MLYAIVTPTAAIIIMAIVIYYSLAGLTPSLNADNIDYHIIGHNLLEKEK